MDKRPGKNDGVLSKRATSFLSWGEAGHVHGQNPLTVIEFYQRCHWQDVLNLGWKLGSGFSRNLASDSLLSHL